MKRIAAAAFVVLALTAVPLVRADHREEHFTIYPGPCAYDAFLLAGTSDAYPNSGIGCYVIRDVQAGAPFMLVADDGQEPFVVGTAQECPGPDWDGHLADEVGEGDAAGAANVVLSEFWLVCNNGPDADVRFSCGEYSNGPGDEAGTIPCDGDAIIELFGATEPESYTWSGG